MQTVRHTQTSSRWRMRHVRTLIMGATAVTAALSVAGLTATAQAAPDVAVSKTVNVPAGVATFILSPACPSGNTASLSSSTPALPSSVKAIAASTKLKVAGVFPGSPASLQTQGRL